MIPPGEFGTPLPESIAVLRLTSPSLNGRVSELAFELSSADKESNPPSLSVWVRENTTPEQAFALLGANPKYTHYFLLSVNDVRLVRPEPENDTVPSLDVIWVPLDSKAPGAEGHAGLTGLNRPPGLPKDLYHSLRRQLPDLANKSLFPLVHNPS